MRTNQALDQRIGGQSIGSLVRAPLAAQTWLGLVHLVTGAPLGLVSLVVVLTFGVLTVALAITVLLAIGSGVALVVSVQLFTALQRARFAGLLEVHVTPPIPPDRGVGLWAGVRARARSRDLWRQLGYHLLAGVTGPLFAGVALLAWGFALTASTVLLHVWFLPGDGVIGVDVASLNGRLLLIVVTLVGLLALVAAPRVTRVLVSADIAIARSLLEPDRTEALTERVSALAESRADVVDAADAERRRIERDLHDGAQQRLVSLAMNLGMARAALTDAPEPARAAIAAAHEEAKLALAELRDFVRGLHPAVLEDRGLDAALSGIAAHSPIPVRLVVDLPYRPSPTVEAIAYFVVSESLTNAAKHSQARSITVELSAPGADRINVKITDDGCGGADAGAGTGLRGLAQRVRSVDGSWQLSSPAGGPTIVEVELPCVS